VPVPSWWLKVERAKLHFAEFERAARTYADRHPYSAECVRYREGKRQTYRYVLRIGESPPAILALALGDAFHNLRCALDHIASALVPGERKSHAYFPILTEDIWAVDPAGNLLAVHEDARIRFEQATRGMSAEALAVILEAQPYRRNPDQPTDHALSRLNRFDNADKHSRLIAFAHGLRQSVVNVFVRGVRVATVLHDPRQTESGVLEDGAEIVNQAMLPGRPPESEVEVDVRGTIDIALKVGLSGRHVPAVFAFGECVATVEDMLRSLADYAEAPKTSPFGPALARFDPPGR
jgi:hypothetical protein